MQKHLSPPFSDLTLFEGDNLPAEYDNPITRRRLWSATRHIHDAFPLAHQEQAFSALAISWGSSILDASDCRLFPRCPALQISNSTLSSSFSTCSRSAA